MSSPTRRKKSYPPAEINTTFTDTFNTSFTELLVKHEKEVQKKPTPVRKSYGQSTDSVVVKRMNLLERQLFLPRMNRNEAISVRESASTSIRHLPLRNQKQNLTHPISLMLAGIRRKYSMTYSSIPSFRHQSTGSSLPEIIMFRVQMQVK
jgi:hypothetical protein